MINCCAVGETECATDQHGLWRDTPPRRRIPYDDETVGGLSLTDGTVVGDTVYPAAKNGLHTARLTARIGLIDST